MTNGMAVWGGKENPPKAASRVKRKFCGPDWVGNKRARHKRGYETHLASTSRTVRKFHENPGGGSEEKEGEGGGGGENRNNTVVFFRGGGGVEGGEEHLEMGGRGNSQGGGMEFRSWRGKHTGGEKKK